MLIQVVRLILVTTVMMLAAVVAAAAAGAAPITIKQYDDPVYRISADLDPAWATQGSGGGDFRFAPSSYTEEQVFNAPNEQWEGDYCDSITARSVFDFSGRTSVQQQIKANYSKEMVSELGSGVFEVTPKDASKFFPKNVVGGFFVIPMFGGGCIELVARSQSAMDAARAFASSAQVIRGYEDSRPALATPTTDHKSRIAKATKRLQQRNVRIGSWRATCRVEDIVWTTENTTASGGCPTGAPVIIYAAYYDIRMRPGYYYQMRSKENVETSGPTGYVMKGRRAWIQENAGGCWSPSQRSDVLSQRANTLQIYLIGLRDQMAGTKYLGKLKPYSGASSHRRYSWRNSQTSRGYIDINARGDVGMLQMTRFIGSAENINDVVRADSRKNGWIPTGKRLCR
jgi:hypothetical protein